MVVKELNILFVGFSLSIFWYIFVLKRYFIQCDDCTLSSGQMFKAFEKRKRIDVVPFITEVVNTEMDCLQGCQKTFQCKSINGKLNGMENFSCEFLSHPINSTTKTLKNTEGFMYYEKQEQNVRSHF